MKLHRRKPIDVTVAYMGRPQIDTTRSRLAPSASSRSRNSYKPPSSPQPPRLGPKSVVLSLVFVVETSLYSLVLARIVLGMRWQNSSVGRLYMLAWTWTSCQQRATVTQILSPCSILPMRSIGLITLVLLNPSILTIPSFRADNSHNYTWLVCCRCLIPAPTLPLQSPSAR